jgi:hypothetical protein
MNTVPDNYLVQTQMVYKIPIFWNVFQTNYSDMLLFKNLINNGGIFKTGNICPSCVILGFRRKAAENCALLGYYSASSGNFFPMFRDNLSVLSSEFKNPNDGKICCSETSIWNYHYSLRNNPEERNSQLLFLYEMQITYTLILMLKLNMIINEINETIVIFRGISLHFGMS